MPLILDSFTVTFMAGELHTLLKGNEIKGVYISDDRLLSISLRAVGSRPRVLRFLHAPGFALLCVDRQTENESELTHLPRFESLVGGSTVVGVAQVDLDRVVKVETQAAKGERLNLYFELNPSLPNLFLTDSDDTVAAILLKAGTRTRGRRLDVGKPYVARPMPCKIDASEVTEKYVNTLSWWQDDTVLSQSVAGIGPFFSREIAHRGRGQGAIFKAYDELLRLYRAGASKPHTFSVGRAVPGRPPTIGMAWYSPQQEDVRDLRSARTLNDAALRILGNLTATLAFDRRKHRVARNLEREIRKWRKVEAETHNAESERDAAMVYRKCAELLMANPGKVRKGDIEAVLPDLHSGGRKEIRIDLRPELTPQRNAEAYFKRARKCLRRADLAHEKLEAARRRLSILLATARELEGLADARRLTEIEEKVLIAPPAGQKEQPPEDERAARLGIRPRRYMIAGGWTVLVGHSAAENDILTHKYASPSDIWFHARQAQGAHVVLRREKGRPGPPKEAILEAAAIAAYYSKARTSKHVPVSYAERRYVKKVRKAPLGTAAMLREKVIFVDPALPKA